MVNLKQLILDNKIDKDRDELVCKFKTTGTILIKSE
jgi:hypothetical protein